MATVFWADPNSYRGVEEPGGTPGFFGLRASPPAQPPAEQPQVNTQQQQKGNPYRGVFDVVRQTATRLRNAPLTPDQQRLINNAAFYTDRTGNLTDSDIRRGGLQRIVKTGKGSYTDAPGAQGEERVYTAGGRRVDRQPVGYSTEQLQAFAKANPGMRVAKGGDPLVAAANAMEAAAPRASRRQQVEAGIRDVERFGTPNARAIAAAEREVRDGSPPQSAEQVEAARRAKMKDDLERWDIEGRHAAGELKARLGVAQSQMGANELLQVINQYIPEGTPEDERMAIQMQALSGHGIDPQTSIAGQVYANSAAQIEADAINRQLAGDFLGFEGTRVNAADAANLRPARKLTAGERYGRKALNAAYPLLTLAGMNLGSIPWGAEGAVERDLGDGRTGTGYLTADEMERYNQILRAIAAPQK